MDRKGCNRKNWVVHCESLSARRAWIERPKIGLMPALSLVALRKESVDRKRNSTRRLLMSVVVALRKESVDRKTIVSVGLLMYSVALRKESVDRKL